MFGFFKWKRAVNTAVQYCATMFAGLEMAGEPVPNQAFGDAYVAGFLQHLIMHAAMETGRGVPDPRSMLSIAEA